MNVYSGSIHNCKNGKQLKCSSVGEWINKRIHPYNGIALSNKKEQTIARPATWMNLKNIMLNEKKPVLKGCIIPFSIKWHTYKKKPTETENKQLTGFQDGVGGEWKKSSIAIQPVPSCTLIVVATTHISIKIHWMVHTHTQSKFYFILSS